MTTILPFGVSAPELVKAAGVPLLAADAPKPPASASCSRFFFRENKANMSAPTIVQAASMPIMINTAELVPPESVSDAVDPLLAECDVAFPPVSLADTAVRGNEGSSCESVADDE